jgi:signal transduction histidine kinase
MSKHPGPAGGRWRSRRPRREPRLLRLRARAIHVHADIDTVRLERERLLLQLRQANEHLVLATVEADAKADEARAAQQLAAAHAAALEAQDRTKNEFLAMLGHELRNPLAPILSTLELMRLRSPDVLVEEREIIEDQVRQLARIVDELLDVSRLTEGAVDLRMEPVQLSAVVARAIATVGPIVASKHQHVSVLVDDQLVVNGDFVRLVQIVGNLLSNAAKYTAESGFITVTAERRGPNVVLWVDDSGIGISAAMLPRVFDLFAQEQPDRSQGGLGLGLAITQRLVYMHGGSITAHSDGVGRGTSMELELQSSPLAPRVVSAQPREPSAKTALGVKVLLVDDNQLAGNAMRVLLALRGYEVMCATDGPSALRIAATFVPNVAILDIGLPIMDGYELARRMRARLAPHEVRLIALTGYGQPSDRQLAAEAGFDDHLVKPVELEVIEASLSRLAGRA